MEQEYNIILEDKIEKDVKNMCDLSQYVKEEGIEIGKEIGKAQERAKRKVAGRERCYHRDTEKTAGNHGLNFFKKSPCATLQTRVMLGISARLFFLNIQKWRNTPKSLENRA